MALTERRRADFWKGASVVVCLASLIIAWLAIQAGRQADQIFVMDPSGSLYAGPLEALSESKGYFHLASLYAANAALQRSPAGFDLYEILRLCYTPRAVQKLEEDLQQQREDARRRNLQQKPLVESIGEPVRAGNSRLVDVRGRLVCAGAYAGRSFYDEVPFVLVLRFRRNPDMGKSGSYPWVCEDYDLSMKTPEKAGGP
jgi:hypothetical protein